MTKVKKTFLNPKTLLCHPATTAGVLVIVEQNILLLAFWKTFLRLFGEQGLKRNVNKGEGLRSGP